MFLADDGHEGDLSIPAILISRNDGTKILNYYILHKDKKIRAEIKFEIGNKNNIVNYDIWYTPDIENVYIFLKEFQKYDKALGGLAKMSVHFVTYPYYLYDPYPYTPKENCLGSGLYCIRPGKLGVIDGSIIVIESIKQKCIYDNALKNNKIENFWKFMSNFHEHCISKQDFTQICSNEAITNTGININEINDCLYESFIGAPYKKQGTEYQKINKNTILDKEYELTKQYFISRVPSITINGRLYKGSWKPEFVFEALCAEFAKKPKACHYEEIFKREAKGFSFISTCLIVLLTNIVLFVTCKRYIQLKVGDRIKSSDNFNSYIAFRDSK